MIVRETFDLDDFDEFVRILRADEGRLLRALLKRLAREGDAEAKFINVLRSHPKLRDLAVH